MNERYFLMTFIIESICVTTACCFGKYYKYAMLVTNLLLVTIFGQKLFPLFGIVSNGGNIFYATAVIFVIMLTENYGEREFKSILKIVLPSLIAFQLLAMFTSDILSISDNGYKGTAMQTLFYLIPRIAIASATMFIVASLLLVKLYIYFKSRFPKDFFFRVMATIAVVQVIDSIGFFILAFYGQVALKDLWVSLCFGILLKTTISFIMYPFIFLGVGKNPVIHKKFLDRFQNNSLTKT